MRTPVLTVPAVLTVLTVLTACKKADDQAAVVPPPSDSLTVADSFRTPESVLYDAAGDVYLVANINGNPADKDDNGFISRVNPDGRVDQLKFIDGAGDSVTLNAPKGMGIRGDTLFVADIDEVRMFDRTTGSVLGSRPVRGATFLNDLTVGPDGTVYVTDSGLREDFTPSGSDALIRFDAGGRPVRMIRGDALGRPNGIVADSSGVFVVSYGSGEAYHITPSGERHALPKPAVGELDGLVRAADGALLASSWEDSSIVRLAAGGSAWTKLMGGLPTPADIGLDTRRNRLLIPSFQNNRVEIRPLR